MSDLVLSRRGVLRGSAVAAVGVVAGYLAVRASGVVGDAGGTTAANAYGPSTTGPERLLIALDEVPPGGGVVLGDDGVVLTRTTDGELHAFSAACTHQGCTVATGGRRDHRLPVPRQPVRRTHRCGAGWPGSPPPCRRSWSSSSAGTSSVMTPWERFVAAAPTLLWLLAAGFALGVLLALG